MLAAILCLHERSSRLAFRAHIAEIKLEQGKYRRMDSGGAYGTAFSSTISILEGWAMHPEKFVFGVPQISRISPSRYQNDFPLPYERWRQRISNTIHVRGMASEAFLDDSELVGYFLSTTDPKDNRVIASVKLSHKGFVPVEDWKCLPRDEEDIGLAGSGMYETGGFELEGRYEPDLSVRLAVTRANASMPPEEWQLRFTPWGLIGTWREDPSRTREGFVWLWKREWSTGVRNKGVLA